MYKTLIKVINLTDAVKKGKNAKARRRSHKFSLESTRCVETNPHMARKEA